MILDAADEPEQRHLQRQPLPLALDPGTAWKYSISLDVAGALLERLTGIRQPTLSQQLGVLRNEALVNTRREGKWIYYSVASQEAMAILGTLHSLFCVDDAGPKPPSP